MSWTYQIIFIRLTQVTRGRKKPKAKPIRENRSTSKALVLNALGRGFDFEDVDIAAPMEREVLVNVQASGLSDHFLRPARIEKGDQPMAKHVTISGEEAAERLAIRELVEAYAHCADRRDAKGQMALFTADTHFVVYMNAKDPTPSQELHSREALAPVFADLNKYAETMHFVGQSTILTLTGNRATGEAYTLAHHLTIDGGKRRLMIAALRYSDRFVKIEGAWLFSERLLYVDWIEERALS